jgi:hypothetical protein
MSMSSMASRKETASSFSIHLWPRSMYVALGTTSDGFTRAGVFGEFGCCTSCRPVLEVTEYVDRADSALLCEKALADRGPKSLEDFAVGSVASGARVEACIAEACLSVDSRRVLAG